MGKLVIFKFIDIMFRKEKEMVLKGVIEKEKGGREVGGRVLGLI